MSLNLSLPNQSHDIKPRITVIGVGGAGGNAVNNMIRSNLEGVEFIVANTDAQALAQSQCNRRIQLGHAVTQGLGAGSRPDVGRAAAEESIDGVIEQLAGSNMAFITAGMGGGTGTGAAPVIARAAREHGILTVGVITKPFHFEGVHRMRLAESGIQELQQYVDTLIIIPNQNLFRIANEKTTFADAFSMADQVLYSGVRGVTDLMVMPGLINLDFADIRAIMTEMGKAMMGTGEAEGDNRAIAAAEAAISNPLLDDVSMKGARGVLINITGGPDLTLYEVDEAATRIREEVDPEANIIFGSTFDETLKGRVRISVVATGIDGLAAAQPRPVTLSLVSKPAKPLPVREPAAETPTPAPSLTPSLTMTAPAPHTASVARKIEPAPVAQPVQRVVAAAPMPTLSVQITSAQVTAPVVAKAPEPVRVEAKPVEMAPVESIEIEPTVELDLDVLSVPVAKPAVETRPVQAMPTEERPFIAPAPVEPHRDAGRPATPAVAAQAPAQPTMAAPAPAAATAAAPAEPRRVGNLFARVTGSSGLFARPASPAPKAEAPAETMARPAQAEPTARPAMPAAPAATMPAAPTQTRLAGLDPKDRLAQTRAEEEFFEIPAFLRRQAN